MKSNFPFFLTTIVGLLSAFADESSAPDAVEKDTAPRVLKSSPGDLRSQDKYSRETPEILKAWEPAMQTVRKNTLRIFRGNKQIALACAVAENGYILTKSTEVHDKNHKFLAGLHAEFPDGLKLPLRFADEHPTYDLALLRVDATGLQPIEWYDSAPLLPGAFIAAATPEPAPAATGVLSVVPRSLDESQKGYLGVTLVPSSEGLLKITDIGTNSPASKAGLAVNDVVKSIDGKIVTNVSQFVETVSSIRPWQTVKIQITRNKEDREMEARLGSRPSEMQVGLIEDVRNALTGKLSRKRSGYPDAMQHDMVLQPNEIGGPIVDLDGHVVGLNIARSGRIECLAIPSHSIKQLLSTVAEGRLFHPELDALRAERTHAESALGELKKEIEKLARQIAEVEGKLPAPAPHGKP